MRAEIAEGAILPDYELPDHTDTPRKLSFLQGDDPMILTLNRGVYCPKDRQQLLFDPTNNVVPDSTIIRTAKTPNMLSGTTVASLACGLAAPGRQRRSGGKTGAGARSRRGSRGTGSHAPLVIEMHIGEKAWNRQSTLT